jgi:hypothetical protein
MGEVVLSYNNNMCTEKITKISSPPAREVEEKECL